MWDDVRLAVKLLRRNASFSLLAAGILALGIAAATSIFSVVETVLLRPLPYGEADRLVLIRKSVPARGIEWDWASYPMIRDWSEQSRAFDGITAVLRPEGSVVTVAGDSGLERIQGSRVLPNFFDILAARASRGRTFQSLDRPGTNPVVLSHRLWMRRFGGAASAIGARLRIDEGAATVIGVMPAEFEFPDSATDIWLRLNEEPRWPRFLTARQADAFLAIGRLRNTVSLGEAQSEMNAIAERMAREHPATDAGLGIRLTSLPEHIAGPRLRQTLWLLFGAALCVLLIACTNVANLLLARGAARRRELAMRTALGASRARLVRQMITESVVLSGAGGLLGVVLSSVLVGAIGGLAPGDLPRVAHLRVNSSVLAFSVLLSVVTGLLFGLAPAWQAVSSNIIGATRRGRSARGGLLAVQMALAVVLLSCAGLMIHSMMRLRAVDLGFESAHVLTMDLRLPLPQYAQQERRSVAIGQMIAKIEALPGVQGAVVGGVFTGHVPNGSIVLAERPEERDGGQHGGYRVSAGYFRLLRIPIVEGRDFSIDDKPGSPSVAIVSQSMARRYWPGESAIGKRFKSVIPGDVWAEWTTVVGVAGDVASNGREARALPMIYQPARQYVWTDFSLLVRSSVAAGRIRKAIEEAVNSVEAAAPRFEIQTVEQRLDELEAPRRFETLLLVVFALMALALAAFGIHALLRFFVAVRTKEVGIRVALGAQRHEVAMLTLRQIASWLLGGAMVGVAGSFAAARLIESRLFGVSANDPGAFAAVLVILPAVAAAAALGPVRKAVCADPMQSLRHE